MSTLNATLVTWNIHKGIGGLDRRYRPERIIEVLKHYAPDFALLQEVDEDAHRSSYHRQVDEFGEALGLPHRAYAVTHRMRGGGHYGNAILSRWPITETGDIDLTVGWRKRRGAVWSRVQLKSGSHTRTLALYNLHLGLAGSERKTQLTRFLAHPDVTRLRSDTPIVVAGDLNDLYGSLGPLLLEPADLHRAVPLTNTFPAWAPIRPLDGIFCGGDIEVESGFASRLKLVRSASDHVPLVARFKLSV